MSAGSAMMKFIISVEGSDSFVINPVTIYRALVREFASNEIRFTVSAAEHSVGLTAFGAFCAGVIFGMFIMWSFVT